MIDLPSTTLATADPMLGDPPGVHARQSGVVLPNSADEFSVIDRFRRRFEAAGPPLGPGEKGIGDDAAVLSWGAGPPDLVTATDLVVGGVHVDVRACSPADIGWKAVMVTLSDIGAMGAVPTHALLSVVAPVGFDLDGLAEGVAEAGAAAGCAIVGGDLSSGAELVVSVAAWGRLEEAGTRGPLLRSGARAGDTVLVTGPLGGSAAGLRRIRSGDESLGPDDGAARAAYRRPLARLVEGVEARRCGATAAIDLSDGLLADAGRLAQASGVGIAVDLVPLFPGANEEEGLAGGEEYELLVTTPQPERLEERFAAVGLRTPRRIGRCTEVAGSLTFRGAPITSAGWRHQF